MKKNELRIGNYVCDNYGNIVLLDGIDENFVTSLTNTNIYSDDEVYDYSEILPINITEEIILKNNFQRIDYKDVYWYEIYWKKSKDDRDCITILSTKEIYKNKECISFWGSDIFEGREIKYVHQLQNLYYAITGKELKIKL